LIIEYKNYSAGVCFPFPGPLGCLLQEFPVKLEIVADEVPQYLQLYCDFSEPSYNLCFPFPDPRGWRLQEFAVKLEILELFVPQYSQ
jgi:hypothetical protein